MTHDAPSVPLRDGFRWTSEPWGRALRCEPLAEIAFHFFTTTSLTMRGEPGEREDWARVAASAGVAPDRLWRLKQVHGRDVVVVPHDGNGVAPHGTGSHWAGPLGETSVEGGIDCRPVADIIATANRDAAISVQVADCVPLLMGDRRTGAVAAAHAGWRGTAANVAATAVAVMQREFGTCPEDLVVAHGPSIGPCCYTVGDELLSAFREAGFGDAVDRWFHTDEAGHLRLDLWQANRDQLLAAGVLDEHLHQADLCTFSHPGLFHSYRRDGKGTGRIAAVIRARGK